MVTACPKCGSRNVDATVVALGYQRCSNCNHTEAKIAMSQKGNPDVVGSLIAIGAIALGAVVVGALVDSLLGSSKGDVKSIGNRRFRSLE